MGAAHSSHPWVNSPSRQKQSYTELAGSDSGTLSAGWQNETWVPHPLVAFETRLVTMMGIATLNPSYDVHPIGFSPASIAALRGSRNGGSASFSPSVSIGSSVAKPGPSVAISNRMPLGSRK